MAIAWQDRFTPLANVNNGNELEDGDTATGEHITIALENGAYAKKKADENAADIVTINNDIDDIEERLTNLGFREGVATLSGLAYNPQLPPINSVRKIGKYVLFTLTFRGGNVPLWTSATASQPHTATVPSWARPKQAVDVVYMIKENIYVRFDNGEVSENTIGTAVTAYVATVGTNGVISFTCGGGRVNASGNDLLVESTYNYPTTDGVLRLECGWEIN